jgi:hypothetical protein
VSLPVDHPDQPPLTRDELMSAFKRIRMRRWGDDLDFNLADPVRGKVIVAVAWNARKGPRNPELVEEARAKDREWEGYVAPARLPLDRKRLAAGEREDDD